MKKLFIILFGIIAIQTVVAAASSQASSSAERGSYLAGLGHVIPPDEIHIDAYIAQSDYNYPIPRNSAVNIIPATGSKENTAYLLVGLRGKKEEFEALPPMNLCFVIDISGSMSGQDKLEWVKESLRIFVNKVRPEDFVSVVLFDDRTEIMFKPAHIRSQADRSRFIGLVDALRPRGSTNIFSGMTLGYEQVEANFRSDYSNRVILLTDGMDNVSRKSKKEFLDACALYREKGINISTIGLGEEADINLMVDMAIAGGGSSRFISDRVVMEQTFGSELDRLVVAAAKNLRMELALADGVTLLDTWGYSWWNNGSVIHYSLDTIHNGDYETIVAEVALDNSFTAAMSGGILLAGFSISYEDAFGRTIREGPIPLVFNPERGVLIADERVREAEGYITLARGLVDIGNRSPDLGGAQREFNEQRNALIREARSSSPEVDSNSVPDTYEMAVKRNEIINELEACLRLINSLTEYLNAINDSLGGGKYPSGFGILTSYRASFTKSLESYKGTGE